MRLRRVLLTGVVYVIGSSLVVGTARTVAEVLVLPPLFLTLLAGIVVLCLPLALALAWRYRPPDDGR